MIATLAERLERSYRHRRSGVVHKAYECNRVEVLGEGKRRNCPDGVHVWCSHHISATVLESTDQTVTCKRCATGGSVWASFVVRATHPEIGFPELAAEETAVEPTIEAQP